MHLIQEKLLFLSKSKNLAVMTLREIAAAIGFPDESPQKIKHHLNQLQKRGFITIDRGKGIMDRSSSEPGWAKGIFEKSSQVFSIPILGTANCGPATIYAEENFQGFLKLSSKLVGRSRPDGLYAIKADGTSMNHAELNGKKIEDGDYVIIDSSQKTPNTKDIVLAIIDNKATIKRFIDDRENEQIVLMADSTFDYEPIFLHPTDEFSISGKAIAVFKMPSLK
jgi:SOS-response transcriptional repressor LexA